MSMSRLPLMIMAAFYLVLGSNTPMEYTWIAGALLILASISIYSKKMFPSLEEIGTLLGAGTLIVFASGFLIGLSFIIGSYSIGSFLIQQNLAFLVGLVTAGFALIEFGTGKGR